MAKILCTMKEYDKLSTVLSDSPQYLSDISIIYEIVETVPEIPKDFRYDTETDEFLVYRHKYTGEEIHIVKDPSTYTLKNQNAVDPIQ